MLHLKRSYRLFAIVTLALFLASMLSGCGGGGLAVAALRIIGASAILPDSWTSTGGIVKIIAEVVGAVKDVKAFIRRVGDNDTLPVTLILNSQGMYEAEIPIAGNTDPNQPEAYTIEVIATDTIGNIAEAPEPLEVEVPPVD